MATSTKGSIDNLEKTNNHKVIILGAGVAGLSAANFLYRNGIKDILVLEGKVNLL